MNTVGLIVNPKAGKDIRRIVSYGRFTTDEEKLNIEKLDLVIDWGYLYFLTPVSYTNIRAHETDS